MAKQSRRTGTTAKRSVGTIRVVCPHCGKRVSVPAKLGLGQVSFPCPSCRVPINRALIEAVAADQGEAEAEPAAPTEEATPPES
ncbi:MAG: hypothetical protein KIT87_09955 [Anaerolineae bacterium]|nr:hypothetical protein [Anaerolineae bacterium]